MFGLSSLYTTLIGGALLAIASFGGGFYLEHRLAASTIVEMKLADAQAQVAAVEAVTATTKAQDKAALDAAVAEAQAQIKVVTVTHTITKEIPAHVPPDSSCHTPTYGLVRVLNAAATGSALGDQPAPAGQPDDACAPISWDQFAAAVADDYGAGRQNAEQLNALEASVVAIHNSAAVSGANGGP